MFIRARAQLASLAAVLSLSASASLFSSPAPAAAAAGAHTKTAVLAGGCFWGMEEVFESLGGVTNVVAGFSGGTQDSAHYETVSSGETGHAESVQITYDSSRISYEQLLKVYFTVAIDPTELNYQGPDHGTQYRSAIFYADAAQKHIAEAYIAKLTSQKAYPAPIVTQVVPFRAFYAAEAYHQHYARLNPSDPYIVQVDGPKMEQLKKLYPQMIANAAT